MTKWHYLVALGRFVLLCWRGVAGVILQRSVRNCTRPCSPQGTACGRAVSLPLTLRCGRVAWELPPLEACTSFFLSNCESQGTIIGDTTGFLSPPGTHRGCGRGRSGRGVPRQPSDRNGIFRVAKRHLGANGGGPPICWRRASSRLECSTIRQSTPAAARRG